MLKVIRRLSVFSIFAVFFCSVSFGSRLDSLESRLLYEKDDSVRLSLLIQISSSYNRDARNIEHCESILSQALSIALPDSNLKALTRIYHNFGVLYRNTAQYEKAFENHFKSLKFAQRINDLSLVATANNGIGVVYRRMDNHPEATHYHLLGLRAAEEVGDNFNIAVSLNSLGNIFSLNGHYPEALSYFKRALELAKTMNNNLGQAMNYNNIGEVFEFMESLDSALVYYTKSLEKNEEIKSKKGIAISYNAIGKIHYYHGRNKEALKLFEEALEIDLLLGDKKFIADSYINLGRVYTSLSMLSKAEDASNKGLAIAQQIGSISHSHIAYETLSKVYSKRNKPDTALYLFKKATQYKDSLLNEKNARTISMMEVMFNTEKKENEIHILLQKQEINQKELARQKIIRNFYLVGLIFALVFAGAIYLALNIKRKANSVLAKQKAEIEKSNLKLNHQQNEILLQNKEIENQRSSIEQKNKHLENAYNVIESYIGKITDSIKYAERIQKALLPPLSLSNEYFSDIFCFYRPKDLVSGDFYWLAIKEQKLYLAVADCTGHGVPGAFMSIIGMDILNQAINQQNISEPGEILTYLNLELRKKLQKQEEELILKDSMDIAVVTMEKGSNTILYSSALVPLTVVRNNRIIEYKPNSTSIGISPKVYNKPLKQQTINIEKGDWIYIYSDGYTDQFGGGGMKKLMRKRFYSSLLDISNKSGINQNTELGNIFDRWKGDGEQIDDVLVLGLKV